MLRELSLESVWETGRYFSSQYPQWQHRLHENGKIPRYDHVVSNLLRTVNTEAELPQEARVFLCTRVLDSSCIFMALTPDCNTLSASFPHFHIVAPAAANVLDDSCFSDLLKIFTILRSGLIKR